jgi:hypothetical protein
LDDVSGRRGDCATAEADTIEKQSVSTMILAANRYIVLFIRVVFIIAPLNFAYWVRP